jgi:integrase/recombinase XerC
VPLPATPPKYLTQEEVRRFLGAVAVPRDRLIFLLSYLYGLRVGEVALLRRGDADLDRSRIVIRRLKNGNWTERPLFSSLRGPLHRHLAGNPGEEDDPLFPGRHGPLRKRQIQSLFTRYRDAAGLPGRYSCHGLRHAIATHLLDAGCSLEFVQDHLGHRSIRSTSVYAQITDHHRLALFQRLERSPWIVQPGQGALDVSPSVDQLEARR